MYFPPFPDIQTQIIVIVAVTVVFISILTAVLVAIFFVKGTHSGKPRARLVRIKLEQILLTLMRWEKSYFLF